MARKTKAQLHREHMDEVYARNRAEVEAAGGKCPRCGRSLRQNLALTGWYQCEQLGAVGFRKDADQPSCDFQTFLFGSYH